MPHSLRTTRGVNPHRERTLPTHHWPTLCRGDGMRVTTGRYPPTPQLPCWRGANSTGSSACCCNGSRRSSYKPGTENEGVTPQEWNGTEEKWYPDQIQVQFRRNPQGWQRKSSKDAIVEGKSPPHDRAGVRLHPIDDSVEMAFEQFGKTWARFFPSVPYDQWESYRYPKPLTQEFWALYHEPIEEFIRTAALLEGPPDDAGEGPRDGPWAHDTFYGRLRAGHSRTQRICGDRPVASPANAERHGATVGVPVVIHVARADGLTGRGGREAAQDMPDLSPALRLACLPGTLLFGQMSLHDEQAHVPKTCGQQKPAAAEEPGDTQQKA